MSSEKIRQLQDELKREKRKMDNCNHEFGEAFYNPYQTSEAYGHRTIKQGSDIWGEPEGYRDVTKPRWTRKCAKCGFEQHTEKKKPVITDYKPDFD